MKMEFIAYCGVDCSVCTDYTGHICHGCRQTEWKSEEICLPVACCRKKGISFCGKCDKFPCDEMQGFYEESEVHRKAFDRMCLSRDNAV